MPYYSTEPLNDAIVSKMAGTECVGLGTGESHERIIQSAGGEIGYDGFMDPRPGHSGGMTADRVFINQKENAIQGINFRKNGEFCCSYTGINYDDIRDSNERDCAEKKKQAESATESKTLQKQRDERPPLAPSLGTSQENGVTEKGTTPTKSNKFRH